MAADVWFKGGEIKNRDGMADDFALRGDAVALAHVIELREEVIVQIKSKRRVLW